LVRRPKPERSLGDHPDSMSRLGRLAGKDTVSGHKADAIVTTRVVLVPTLWWIESGSLLIQ